MKTTWRTLLWDHWLTANLIGLGLTFPLWAVPLTEVLGVRWLYWIALLALVLSLFLSGRFYSKYPGKDCLPEAKEWEEPVRHQLELAERNHRRLKV